MSMDILNPHDLHRHLRPDVVAGRFEEMAAAAAAEARAMEPGIEVTSAAVIGDPASALLPAGRTAAMLVVGNRGRGGFASLPTMTRTGQPDPGDGRDARRPGHRRAVGHSSPGSRLHV
jgi:hypothetical protein